MKADNKSSNTPETIISIRMDRTSASGPNTTMPSGRKPEYMAPKSPNIRPCISGAEFSCSRVVDAV